MWWFTYGAASMAIIVGGYPDMIRAVNDQQKTDNPLGAWMLTAGMVTALGPISFFLVLLALAASKRRPRW